MTDKYKAHDTTMTGKEKDKDRQFFNLINKAYESLEHSDDSDVIEASNGEGVPDIIEKVRKKIESLKTKYDARQQKD